MPILPQSDPNVSHLGTPAVIVGQLPLGLPDLEEFYDHMSEPRLHCPHMDRELDRRLRQGIRDQVFGEAHYYAPAFVARIDGIFFARCPYCRKLIYPTNQVVRLIGERITCIICSGKNQVAHITPCGHKFCMTCLEKVGFRHNGVDLNADYHVGH